MNSSRFDAWTRRRLGVAAGGLVAPLVSLPRFDRAAAKKNGKKSRCRKLLKSCSAQGKEERCCQGLNCDPVENLVGLRCCFGRQHRCQGNGECCGETICGSVTGLAGSRCCAEGGGFCTGDADCCDATPCTLNQCAFASDQTLKTNFGSVDPADMLERVRSLPISTWNYTSDDASVRHIGPMAQDFAAVFGVGADDRHIHPLDGQGIALAAIQALAAQLEALQAENARLAARIAELEETD